MNFLIISILFLSSSVLLSNGSVLRSKRQAPDPLRDQLLTRATNLIARANAEIALLTRQGRTGDAAILQQEEALVQELARELRAATTQAQIRLLEQRLNDAENRLDAELARIELEVVNAAQRDAIIARAEQLYANATAEIVKLRAEGRLLLAAQLQFEEAILAELVRELRAARTGQQILALEAQLLAMEDRLAAELQSITHVIADPEKDALIKRADEVSAKAETEIAKLKAANKSQEAETLAVEQRLIAEYVTQLKKVTEAAELTRLKANLKDTLDRVEAEIKKFEEMPVIDAERDALIKRATDLKKRAETQIYKLKSEGKEQEAATLDAEVKLIDELVNQLPKTNDTAELTRLKTSLKENLDKLESQVKALESVITDSERDALVKRAEELINKTIIEINQLKENGKTAEVSALTAEQKLVEEVVKEAKAANNATELKRVKDVLKQALDQLEADLKKFAEIPIEDSERDSLIKRAEALKSNVTAEISKLNAAGKTSDALSLEAQQKLSDELVSEMKKPTNASELARLKASLKTVLDNLEAQLKKLEENVNYPERDALIKRAEELKPKVTAEIAKLKTAGRTSDAAQLEARDKLIDELVAELKKATDAAELKRLKDALKQNLDQLEEDIKKLETAPVADPEKDALVKRAEETSAKIKEAEAKLNAANKTADAATLALEQKLIDALAAQLKNATLNTDSLKSVLKSSLDQVDEQLKKINATPVVDAEKESLLKRADELVAKATATISKLKTDGRTQEAATLEAEDTLAKALAEELKRTADDSADLKRVKDSLKAALDKLEADIKEAEKPVTNEELKNHLINKTQDLDKKAKEAIEKLRTDGRSNETAELEKQAKAIEALTDDLKKTTTAAELKPLETKVDEAEKALNTELERVAKPVINKAQVDALTQKIASVALKAKEGVKKLQAQGSTADGLEMEVQLLAVLDVVLQAVTTPAEVTAVSDRLTQIEKSVDEQLSKIPA